jgi:hypothetical protein
MYKIKLVVTVANNVGWCSNLFWLVMTWHFIHCNLLSGAECWVYHNSSIHNSSMHNSSTHNSSTHNSSTAQFFHAQFFHTQFFHSTILPRTILPHTILETDTIIICKITFNKDPSCPLGGGYRRRPRKW